YIDFGREYKEIVDLILPGDPIIFDHHYYVMNNRYVISNGLDDKVGTYVLIELLKYFDTHIEELKYNLIINFMSREEIGLGSFGGLMHLPIDQIIVIDAHYWTDSDLMPIDLVGVIKQKNGPIITREY